MKYTFLVWLAKLVLKFIDWCEPPAKRKPVLPPPPAPKVLLLNADALERLSKADFYLGCALGTQPTWIGKPIHDSHKS